MWQHAKKSSANLLRAAGGAVEHSGEGPETPGYSQHEIGTCRMGNDPKEFVTNRFGQTHDVKNLFICDGSVFVNCTDKAPTLSILAISLRTSEFLLDQFSHGVFRI